MAKVSAKRQITLPINQCELLGIEPGDEIESFVADGHITIIKKTEGAAQGFLKGRKSNAKMTDEASLESALN